MCRKVLVQLKNFIEKWVVRFCTDSKHRVPTAVPRGLTCKDKWLTNIQIMALCEYL